MSDYNPKWKFRIGDLEINSCNENFLTGGNETTAEICKWETSSRYTIAFFKKSGDYFNLITCGDRPFKKEINKRDFVKLCALGFKLLRMQK